MKILMVSATDRLGGAAIGAYRLHQALRRAGIQSEMLVLRKVSADPNVHRLSSYLNRWGRMQRRLAERRHQRQLKSNPRKQHSGYWSLNRFSYPIAEVINSFAADVVHLHWVGDNYLPISEIAKIRPPIVWTLHDMWAFTGGCHSAYECLHYREGCGNCPLLLAGEVDDISARVNRDKKRVFSTLPITLVCPSQWLGDCAGSSFVFNYKRIEVIGNPINSNIFKPLDRAIARHAYNLPSDKRLILFGAIGGTSDAHKGFYYLQKALSNLQSVENLQLAIFGEEYKEDLNLDLPCYQMGRLQDEVSLSLLYSACDVFVLPSLQENLPYTLLEALACGTPCVTFGGSGATDIVQHRRNGYLARLQDSDDLRQGIEWVLSQEWPREELHSNIIERYGEGPVSQQYIRLYQSLVNKAP